MDFLSPEEPFFPHELLPPEVWELIFLHLETADLANVRRTCARWRAIVDGSPSLANKFEISFPRNLLMDWRYTPECMHPSARTVLIGDSTIERVGHWWPELGRRLVRLKLDNCAVDFPDILDMLRETPGLRQLHLDVVMSEPWSEDDLKPDFCLQRLEQLRSSFACQNLGRICPKIKFFVQLDDDIDPNPGAFAQLGQFLAETQDTLEALVFQLTARLLEQMAGMERLRLRQVQITNAAKADLVVQLSRLQPSLRDVELTAAVMTGEQLSQLGRNVPALQSLSVTVLPPPTTQEYDNNPAEAASFFPSYLRYMPALEVLTLRHVQFFRPRLDFGALANPRLRHLSLNDTRDCIRLKEYLGRCKSLERLDMHGCHLASWTEVFGAVQQARNSLVILCLSCMRVEDGGRDCLTVGRVGKLDHLTLRSCDVSKAMLLQLIAVCPALTQVQFGLMATVDDAVVLAACLGLPRLVVLVLFRCTGVTDESAGSLIRFGGEALQYVALIDCEGVTAEAKANLQAQDRFRVYVRLV